MSTDTSGPINCKSTSPKIGLGLHRLRPGRVLTDDRRMAARHPHADRSSADAVDGALTAGHQNGSGLIPHTDLSSQYMSIGYGKRLLETGATASVDPSRTGTACHDWGQRSFKSELIDHQGPLAGRWPRRTCRRPSRLVECLHSYLDYLPPRNSKPSTTSQAATNVG